MKKILLLAIMALTLASCSSTKETALNDLRSFNTELQLNANDYTVRNWYFAKNKYVKINKKILKHKSEYTAEESKEIGNLNGQIMGTFGNVVAGKASSLVTNASSALQGFMEGLQESLGIKNDSSNQ